MFSNLSNAQQVSAQLLSLFGKHTDVLMEVHGYEIRVRRAHDNAQIARLHVASYSSNREDGDYLYITGIDSNGDSIGGFKDYNMVFLSWAIMAAPKFPKLYKRDKRWSPIKNKIVEGAY